MKKSVGFKWKKAQEDAFQLIKEKLYSAPLLALLNFSKTFEIKCHVLRICIRAVLMPE